LAENYRTVGGGGGKGKRCREPAVKTKEKEKSRAQWYSREQNRAVSKRDFSERKLYRVEVYRRLSLLQTGKRMEDHEIFLHLGELNDEARGRVLMCKQAKKRGDRKPSGEEAKIKVGGSEKGPSVLT